MLVRVTLFSLTIDICTKLALSVFADRKIFVQFNTGAFSKCVYFFCYDTGSKILWENVQIQFLLLTTDFGPNLSAHKVSVNVVNIYVNPIS